ncbi:MAG: addiction module antitoxin, partial [Alphaproteobacteria bacterium]|nr:addiction module antitoxin [Alphaproteobacteria bacterium]
DDGGESEIPNLERQIERQPELFVQAVAFVFKRSDGADDPPAFSSSDPQERAARAANAYRLLQALRRIPGRDRFGHLDSNEIINWVARVREGCAALGRAGLGDEPIGEMFARAPVDEDGVWPVRPVRDALETVLNSRMADGVQIGLHNKRGVVWRGEGGRQERELVSVYQAWARALAYTHPQVSRIMVRMADSYAKEADWHDTDANIRKRLPY